MTHAKLLALVGYLWCTISTFVLKYDGAVRFIMAPSMAIRGGFKQKWRGVSFERRLWEPELRDVHEFWT